MPDWMLDAPPYTLSPADEQRFQDVLDSQSAARLSPHLPRWVFLQWAAQQGYLLHGSKQDYIAVFEPRAPHDLGPDEFSKRTGVFAASDGLWAMMFALRDKTLVRLTQSLAQQLREGQGWTGMKYFLSFAPIDPATTDGRALMTPGFVYLLPREGFEQAPVVQWPGVGECLEAQWVNPGPVRPLMCVAVCPEDFPLPVRVHDAERVRRLVESDPWGFPWLED